MAMVLCEFEFEPLGFVDGKGGWTDAFPGLRASFPGPGVMAPEGDMKVRIKRRRR